MKQELIERFELEHPNEPAYLPIVGGKEHLGIETSRIYSDAFHNWLRDTVIAELQSENEWLKGSQARWRKNAIDKTGNLKVLQEKYDKLKERVEGAPIANCMLYEGVVMIEDLDLDIQPDTKYALVELTPEEMDGEL